MERSHSGQTEVRGYLRLACLLGVLGGLIMCASAAPPAPAPAAPAAPNESVVMARVIDAVVVDSATLGMQPPQPICVLTLRVLSTATTGDLPPAVRAAGETVRAYAKDPGFVHLKGTTITAALTLRGDEHGGRLWLVRLVFPGTPR